MDREYSLESTKRKPTETDPATQTCPKCAAVFLRGPSECPVCGAPLARERVSREIQEIDGVEVSFDEMRRRLFSESGMAQAYRDLVAEGQARGYKPGWAAFRFREQHGFWPRKAWAQAPVRQEVIDALNARIARSGA